MPSLNAYDILFIEDDPIIRSNYSKELKVHFKNVYEAPDAFKGYELYQEKKPHIMIVDINLPKMSGLELLKKIRKTDQNTKAIVLTAHTNKEFMLQAASLKLNEYLVKPVNRHDFRQALEKSVQEIESFNIVSVTQDTCSDCLKNKIEKHIQELKEENEKLLELCVRDKLTGLFNRVKLDEVLEKQIQMAKRYKTTFSMILMDVDFFKSVNDCYGHKVGDDVLRELSSLLMKNIRKTDALGRWGGEEFMLLCPQSNEQQTKDLACKMKEKVANHHFKSIDRKITLSIGVCQYKEKYTCEEMLMACDQALYQAKNEGRNKVKTSYD
jgi:diguanylate cyclase (GGDEF)-like protein